MGNELMRDRLHEGLRNAMGARDRLAASALRSALAALDNAGAVPADPAPAAAGYEGAGHGEQARRLRQEARILASVLDAGARG